MNQEFDKIKLDQVKQKGFCPNEHMNDLERFKEQLPIKEKFYSLLTGKKSNDKGYEHVLNVWNKSGVKAMKDYHDLYLKRNVLILADIIEKFRNNSLKNYGLCPNHYLRAPGWDTMPKMKKTKLELITDPDM